MFDEPSGFEIVFGALGRFSSEELRILGQVLPAQRTVGYTLAEKEVVERFIAAKSEICHGRIQDIVNETMAELPSRGEAREIRKVGVRVFREIANHWGYGIRREEPDVWMLTKAHEWGSIEVPFELHKECVFSYEIYVRSERFSGLPEHDSYLARLGLDGRSACKIFKAEACGEKLWRVADVIHWQLSEYIRIMETLASGRKNLRDESD